MQLHYSSPSPFASKVRFAAEIAKIPLKLIPTDTKNLDDSYYAKNPLGKIPMLITKDGQAVFDSNSITRYFDRLSNENLYPKDSDALLKAETFEALCDGLAEAAVLVIYEERFRPAEIRHQPWVDKQLLKVTRALDYLNENVPSFQSGLDISHAALAAALGYITLRLNAEILAPYENLQKWLAEFANQLPNYEEIKPQ